MHRYPAPLIVLGLLLVAGCATVRGGSAGQGNTSPEDSKGVEASTPAPPADINRALPCPPGGTDGLFGPVPWSVEDGPNRWGWSMTQFEEVRTSHARPIEVCGVAGQLQWLSQLTCPDGSATFGNPSDVHGSRVGSMGAGGRCTTVIDLYRVRCGSQTLDVYMDMYHCTPDESLL